jgi:subfamily B ATP-binding cassette protein MsbA
MLAVTIVNISVPYFFGKEVVDKILISGQGQAKLNLLVVGIVGLYFLKGIFFYGQNYLMAFVANRTIADLRAKTYQHLQSLSLGFHESVRTGELISRLTNDLSILQNALAVGFVELVSNFLWLVGILFYVFYISPQLALIALIALPLAAVAINSFGGKIRRVGHLAQEKAADLTSILSETLGEAVRVVKAFTMEKAEQERFQKENERNFEALMRNVQLNSTLTPVVELIVTVSLVAVLWYGGREVIVGRLTTGELFSFLLYLAMAMGPVSGLSRAMSVWQQARAASERVEEIIRTPVDVKQPANPVVLKIKGHVLFEDLSFAYQQCEEVLTRIQLEVEPGEVVALVGHSGSGKTTMVNLLPRFYDPTGGRVLVDGVDLREVDLYSLRRQIGLVPQEVVLFSTTIMENIAYGRPEATKEEIYQAAKLANAHEFIEELPSGYQTKAGERGAFLSGGQRQRIAIARAILRDPKILILDEATSALDNEAEALLQEALSRLMQGRTTFIIAHRLSTIMQADRIIVLEQGEIVEQGRHSQLLEQGGTYKKLYEAGLRGE